MADQSLPQHDPKPALSPGIELWRLCDFFQRFVDGYPADERWVRESEAQRFASENAAFRRAENGGYFVGRIDGATAERDRIRTALLAATVNGLEEGHLRVLLDGICLAPPEVGAHPSTEMEVRMAQADPEDEAAYTRAYRDGKAQGRTEGEEEERNRIRQELLAALPEHSRCGCQDGQASGERCEVCWDCGWAEATDEARAALDRICPAGPEES